MVLGDVLYGSLHLMCVLSKGGLFLDRGIYMHFVAYFYAVRR